MRQRSVAALEHNMTFVSRTMNNGLVMLGVAACKGGCDGNTTSTATLKGFIGNHPGLQLAFPSRSNAWIWAGSVHGYTVIMALGILQTVEPPRVVSALVGNVALEARGFACGWLASSFREPSQSCATAGPPRNSGVALTLLTRQILH
jgi:hypothetical protein